MIEAFNITLFGDNGAVVREYQDATGYQSTASVIKFTRPGTSSEYIWNGKFLVEPVVRKEAK